MPGKRRIPAPPVSPLTRAKQSAVRRGRPVSEAARAQISEKLTGRELSDATKAKLSAAQRKWRAMTPEEQATEKRRRAISLDARRCMAQLKVDLHAAAKARRYDLIYDLRQSQGRWVKRKLHDPLVSDGYQKGVGVMRYPFLVDLRKPGHPNVAEDGSIIKRRAPHAGWRKRRSRLQVRRIMKKIYDQC